MRFFVKFLSAVKTSYLPALVLFFVSFFCVAYSNFSPVQNNLLQIAFYVSLFLSLCVVLFSQNLKNIFFLLLLLIISLVFNHLRFLQTPSDSFQNIYSWIMLLVPLTFACLAILPKRPNRLFLIFILLIAEGAVIENFYISQLSLPFEASTLISYIFWFCVFLYLLIFVSAKPDSISVGLFFVFISLFLALENVTVASTFALYLLGAALILLVSHVYAVFYEYYKDELTGVYSKDSFLRHDQNKFPPKYTLAFFYIDNYPKLLKVFGADQTDKLTLMITRRLLSLDPPATIYRLRNDEFCLVFFDSDIKEAYEITENIRRLIAKTEFVLSPKKILKLTITPVVSEKRRSDIDAKAVLLRMHESFYRKYRFTQNMTFCEELERLKKSKKTAARS